ncbi:6-hydroxypseudooxynicotine dehydrogenase complex subunit alpha [Roseivivax sp. THAF40]|uniref:FAD binding domain-containing protein n=1 Tax=unclassified Roseivivax TaxID=2639302 RepID=UPI001268F189|nr:MULTISPECIES: FAD binding domain-containing protein [unclassified Roseivivax]QFS82818.1 6-hydroxypseudooxynicotine dehydrogenase complex subunit alpha [Roseivivax sp. THAF197b]QFT46587.1 6-hydroxypseudooxynicotine dehydrogenase complex subunit alpha [Roseivivax sp. THAF40]
MKAADFAYEKPDSLDAALALLADPDRDASPIAGGQSLVPMMNFRMAMPELLVDLNGLDELRGISADAGGGLRIGAMTRYSALEASDLVTERAPIIAMALPHIAHAAIRNRGTIGGSVSLADPAAEMPALMLVLDAEIEVQSAKAQRRIKADEFFTGLYETALDEGELVTAIHVPAAPSGRRFAFYELARRHGDYAMAGVAIAGTGDALEDPRIAFFSVSDRALRARGAEAALAAGDVEGAIAALDEIDFAGDLNADAKTKRHLAGVVLKRALGRL